MRQPARLLIGCRCDPRPRIRRIPQSGSTIPADMPRLGEPGPIGNRENSGHPPTSLWPEDAAMGRLPALFYQRCWPGPAGHRGEPALGSPPPCPPTRPCYSRPRYGRVISPSLPRRPGKTSPFASPRTDPADAPVLALNFRWPRGRSSLIFLVGIAPCPARSPEVLRFCSAPLRDPFPRGVLLVFFAEHRPAQYRRSSSPVP